jgi:excisionase family DNA binding protein
MKITFEQVPDVIGQLADQLSRLEKLIVNLQPEQVSAPLDEPLTVPQAADLLNLSTLTVYDYCKRRILPHSKYGNRIYFSKRELIDWAKSHRVKSFAQIQAEADNYTPAA